MYDIALRDTILFEDSPAENFLLTQQRRRYARGFCKGYRTQNLFFIAPVGIASLGCLRHWFDGRVVVHLKAFDALLIDC
jgi:hypothetical protein